MQIIQHQELGSAQSSIVFSSIPQTYTDLYLVISSQAVQTGTDEPDNLFLQVNSLTSGYSARNLTAMGAIMASYTNPNNITSKGYIGASASSIATSSPFSSTAVYIPNYAGNTSKSFSSDSVSEANNVNNYKTAISIGATLLSSTDAITSLTITNASGANFAQYSSATLYGITKFGESSPKASGGSVIQAGGYWYHTFKNSGNFTALQSLTDVEMIVVAGGGAGGGSAGGGGGAGGFQYFGSQSLTAASYNVIVGAGGIGAINTDGTNGSNSQFGSLTASVGGGGGSSNQQSSAGNNGGSGGGGNTFPNTGGGSGTSGQGNAGSAGQGTGGSNSGGAGGGAGAAASVAAGGNGTGSYSAWGLATSTGQNVAGTYYYAGGGGGSRQDVTSPATSGGFGGGGAGGFDNGAATAGLMNTGGGGGGGWSQGAVAGGNGGSGIVIVRYPA